MMNHPPNLHPQCYLQASLGHRIPRRRRKHASRAKGGFFGAQPAFFAVDSAKIIPISLQVEGYSGQRTYSINAE